MSPIESIYTKTERKANGIFYTPTFLSEYLAKKVLFYNKEKISSIVDPACGDSILLRSIGKELLKSGLKSLPKIIGIDKDINAVVSSTLKFSEKPLNRIKTDFIKTDGLFPKNGQSSDDGWAQLKNELKLKNGFDIAISNPPWGAELNIYDPLQLNFNFSLAKGQFDIFNLFVEAVLNNLNKGGIFGLILPDSVFSQEQARLRCLLAKGTTISLIARLGEKIFPEINRACVIIIGKKAVPNIHHEVDCFHLSSDFKKRIVSNELDLEYVEKELMHSVPQKRFFENENCIFDISLKSNEQITFRKLQNSIPIKNFVKNTRGAEISKKGMVCLCENCKHWMPIPKSRDPKCTNCNVPLKTETIQTEQIMLNHNGLGNIKLKVGEDLFRFTSTSKSWLNTSKVGINYKDLNIYKGEKILVRKTGVGITASLDYEESITTQVVYILKLKPSLPVQITLEFILAVLNSRAMTYFLIKKFGESEWRSHPYLTQTMLINLPFPKIDFGCIESKKIIDDITRIIKSEICNSNSKNISKENDILIEKMVAHFFKLNKNDYNTIFATLSAAGQLIPIKRLLNCSTEEIFN